MNIPTVTPVSTKAVFTAQDVPNKFEREITQQRAKNLSTYQKQQMAKRITKGARR